MKRIIAVTHVPLLLHSILVSDIVISNPLYDNTSGVSCSKCCMASNPHGAEIARAHGLGFLSYCI